MLSNNNMLTTGGRSQRQRRSVRVNKPAQGFFITGSSLDGMNGVYVARRPPRVLADSEDPVAALYYEHEDGLWHMALNELPGAEEEEEEDEEDFQRHYWRAPKEKKPTHEWIFTDPAGRARFMHDGDTIIPGAGVRWKHVHRDISSSSATAASSSNSSTVATVSEDDEDELPWQVIAILDVETVQDLLWSSQCRQEKVRAARAGRTADPPTAASLEGAFTPGAWLFRVKTTGGVALLESPDEDAAEAGRRECGEYLKGVELSKAGDWLRLDKSEDTEGRDRRFMMDDSDDEEEAYFSSHRKKHNRYYNHSFSRRELWVKVSEEGWAGSYELLEEVAAEETAVLEQGSRSEDKEEEKSALALGGGYTEDYFDKPFVPRMEEAGNGGEGRAELSKEDEREIESLAATLKKDRGKEEQEEQEEQVESQIVPGGGVPVGAAVTVSGLKSRTGRQYNQVSAVVVQALDAGSGRLGVRLEAPFSGKLLSCRPDNLVFRLDEDEDEVQGGSRDSEGGSIQRAARLLGLSLPQLGLPFSSEGTKEEVAQCGNEAEPEWNWGFGGSTARQRVGTALRAFLRLDHEVGGGFGDPGREAAALLLEEVDQRKTPAAGNEEMLRGEGGACSPVHLLSHGALGAEVAAVVSAALDPFSSSVRVAGLKALQECVSSEQRRVRRAREAVFVLQEAAALGEDSAGGDELLLRLVLIQALLEGRREAEALEEARRLMKFEADEVRPGSEGRKNSAVVSYLLGCCLLRQGDRARGLTALEEAKVIPLPLELHWLAPLQEWGAANAQQMVLVHNTAEKCKAAAVELYARGAFEEAAAMYGKALKLLEVGCVEDKRGRAICLTDQAGCLRRARKLEAAVEVLDAALRLFPRYGRALFRRAACLLELPGGRADEAVQGFRALYRVDRDWPGLSEWLVRAYTLRKRQARGDYKSQSEGDNQSQQYDNPSSSSNSGDNTDQTTGGEGSDSGEADRLAKEVDHYAVLGVTTDATDKQLKTAYRMRSLKFHPDKKGGHTAAFQRVAEAYQTLSEPASRAAYDEGGDIKVKRGRRDEDDDSDDSEEEHKTSMREEVEREFYPERYHFWPFGDPFIYKRKREAQKRKKEGRQAWQEDPWA